MDTSVFAPFHLTTSLVTRYPKEEYGPEDDVVSVVSMSKCVYMYACLSMIYISMSSLSKNLSGDRRMKPIGHFGRASTPTIRGNSNIILAALSIFHLFHSTLTTMQTLTTLHAYIPPLLTPPHRFVPFGPIDIFGAMRLSSVVNWIASGAFDEPTSSTPSADTMNEKGTGKRKKTVEKSKGRPGLLQELLGIMVVVFGGETFLCESHHMENSGSDRSSGILEERTDLLGTPGLCTGISPSWLLNPRLAILFAAIHTIQTRTFLIHLLPKRPTLGWELLMAFPDAIARALLLTQFSIVPLLHPIAGTKTLPPTSSTLLLVPFILAVPFASMMFTGLNMFTPSPILSTPAELQPWGWTAVDAWAPLVVPALFLSLIGPVEGWQWGSKWTEQHALVVCIGFLWAAFTARALYNFGHKAEHWSAMFGLGTSNRIKTA